jgi:hypothetical protein
MIFLPQFHCTHDYFAVFKGIYPIFCTDFQSDMSDGNFPGIFLPFPAHILKCTDEANPVHSGVQMPILQLLQAVHLPESEKGSLTLFLEL